MIFDPNEEEEEKEDYFETPENPVPPQPEEPKRPHYKPEDPDYWEEDESEWEHLRPRKNGKVLWWLGGAFVIIALIVACWLRYFSPYIEDATQYGYVENIEHRGTVFMTYEGVLIPYKELMDTTRVYRRDFIFSAANEKIAADLKRAMLAARPVRVEYKQYHASLPWRGASKTVIIAVDSVDPSRILPPEFTPAH